MPIETTLHIDKRAIDHTSLPIAATELQVFESTDDDLSELAAFFTTNALNSQDIDEDNPAADDDFFAELDNEFDDFMADLHADPTAARRSRGLPLWVGLDAEWVFNEEHQSNTILSIQLYVPPQDAFSSDPIKQASIKKLSRVIYARSPTPAGRPSLQNNLRLLVDQALEARLLDEAPKVIYVAGFGLRFDLGALGDFPELKTQIDSVSGKVATVGAHAKMEYARTLITGDLLSPIVIGLRFIDVAAHVPVGTALRHIGLLLGKPKLDIPYPYSIERMDQYLREDRLGFEAYAMRDAEVAVDYAMRLAVFAKKKLGIESLPATASGLALKWCLNTLDNAKIDQHQAFGLCRTSTEVYHSTSKKVRTIREVEHTAMRRIMEPFLTDCYAGGRNEAYSIGPSSHGEWLDFDLAGAYSTGLVDLPLIDFEHPRPSLNVEDFLGHVAGYALLEFEHEEDTRFPVFAISRGGKGLIFPLKGLAYATAPEIQVAYDLNCKMTIRWGVVYSWLNNKTAELSFENRLFAPFVKEARLLRTQLKQEAYGKDSLEEQAAKLYANSIYGKICQSLRPKNVFDTRKVSSIRLKPSAITHPAIGAHVTGFIRAILAEILNKIPLK